MNQKYYQDNSEILGWGEKNAKLDLERLGLIKKFVKGKKILDVGCGHGIYVDKLNKDGFFVTGVDFIKDFLNNAKKSKNGKFVYGKAEKLPFNDNSFETVLLFDILEHGDDFKILTEAKRVATERILVIVPKVVDKRLSDTGVIPRHYIDKSHKREYEKNNLEKLGERCGLSVTNIQPIHNLYVETIFMELFEGSKILKKIIRKLILFLFKKREYPTELFVAFDKR